MEKKRLFAKKGASGPACRRPVCGFCVICGEILYLSIPITNHCILTVYKLSLTAMCRQAGARENNLSLSAKSGESV
jgi:hypothetical protein